MANKTSDRTVNTSEKVTDDGVKRMPHERDESPQQDKAPRGVMQQAADDLAQGLVDTDMHGQRGVEQVKPRPGAAGQARPQQGGGADGADDAAGNGAGGMRHQAPATPPKGEKK